VSVHRERRPDGSLRYKVRWRQAGKQRAKTFTKLADARAFDAEVGRLRQLGDTSLLERGAQPFGAYAEDWWARYAVQYLSFATQQLYSLQLAKRIEPEWGAWRLRDITPAELERWVTRLRTAGAGDPTILKALTVMQAIFKQAVVDEEIARNPVALMRKPRQRRKREPVMLAPLTVERARAHLLDGGRLMDATLVSLLAYAGPRPESEAIALTWADVRARVLRITSTKQAGAKRSVRLLAPLARDLREWKVACGQRTGLVFARPDGGPWGESDWDNWRERVFRPALLAAGVPADTQRKITRRGKTTVVQTTSVRPRDLRSSFASLLIAEGQSVVEVARQLGHEPQTCLRDYAGLFDDFDPSERLLAEDVIEAARRKVFGDVFPVGSHARPSAAGESP
jgi:integrase